MRPYSIPPEELPDICDQRKSRSCTGFSLCYLASVASMRLRGRRVVFSKQNFVDNVPCNLEKFNSSTGFYSGTPLERALEYAHRVGFVPEDKYRSYDGRLHHGWPCAEKSVLKIKEYKSIIDLPFHKQKEYLKSDFVIGSFKSFPSFHMFRGRRGVYKPTQEERDAGTTHRHAVFISGYGHENHSWYFRVVNSWGMDSGVDGIAKIQHGLFTKLYVVKQFEFVGDFW